MKAVNIEWDIDVEDGDVLLPDKIDIPKHIVDEDEISDYISDLTGFCHKGFELVNDSSDKVKVIFLDVDGVLNNNRTVRTTKNLYTFVGKRHIRNLKHIINATGAKVVLSSDWRYDRDDPKSNSDFLELKHELLKYGIRFYGFTPELPDAHRGAEIEQWLKEHTEVEDYVILDDRTDMEPNKDHWVQTVMNRGLGTEEAEAADRKSVV